MGAARQPLPVKLICGMIAGRADLFGEAEARLAALYGPVDGRSDVMAFDLTDYYSEEMGQGLLRQFVTFQELIDPGRLARIKLETNEIERGFHASSAGAPRRRINLDPGYLTAAKFVLATTKDFAHRVYLSDGIYAEVTLGFRKSGCVSFDWTYPDFRSPRYAPFLLEARRRYMAEVDERPKPPLTKDQ